MSGRLTQVLTNTYRRLAGGRNLSKFVVLNHFGLNVFHKESPSPVLFTLCISRRVVWRYLCRNDRDVAALRIIEELSRTFSAPSLMLFSTHTGHMIIIGVY